MASELYEKQKEEMTTEFKTVLMEKEDLFRDNMDKLEEEFKTMLIELNNKHKLKHGLLQKKMGENVFFIFMKEKIVGGSEDEHWENARTGLSDRWVELCSYGGFDRN